jgi:thiamine biosynthesis lipoprotein
MFKPETACKKLLVLTVIAALLLVSCTPRPRTYGASMMGTEVAVTIHDGPFSLAGKAWEAAADSAFAEMRRVETMCWSGELAVLNDSADAGVPFEISSELLGLIDHAFELSEATGLAFSPALGRLVDAWGIAKGEPRLPEAEEIERLVYRAHKAVMTRTNDGRVWLRPRGVEIELGAIAKGYAVDRAVEVLHQQGITAGMVWAGGDLRVFGKKPGGDPWRIAVRHPRDPSEFLSVLELEEPMAVATSGDYERFFERDGVRYHHILDPETGYPSRKSVSATVVAQTCMDADALATAVFVMGPEWGVLFAEELGLGAMVAAQVDTGIVLKQSADFDSARVE